MRIIAHILVPLQHRDIAFRFVPDCVIRHAESRGTSELKAEAIPFEATVTMFADISGYTQLAERLGRAGAAGVEILIRSLNMYFSE